MERYCDFALGKVVRGVKERVFDPVLLATDCMQIIPIKLQIPGKRENFWDL